MNPGRHAGRTAVCTWSLQPKDCRDLIQQLHATGLRRVQLALDPIRERATGWADFQSRFRDAEISVVSGMFGCVGEDYSTLESIRRTGGIAPDAHWPANLQNATAVAGLAAALGLKLVTFHAGFLPHDPADPNFRKMQARLSVIARVFADHGVSLALETGQETAGSLSMLLAELDAPNLGVNFDPANMLLYNKGDPIEALRTLGPWIRQVHIKDARRTKIAETWGEEVPVGQGEVNWKEFFGTLRQLRFAGDFVIEREAGRQRIEDIRAAHRLVQELNSEA
jgi:L-ribulose-5-phosphate 3-epimerase